MPSLQFDILFKKNEGLILSPFELLELYFYGIKIESEDGTEISNQVLATYIEGAQREIEKYLNIKLVPQIIEEDKDFYREDFRTFNYLRTTYPVVKPISLFGFFADIKQIEYPPEWLTFRKTSDGELFLRHLYVIPGAQQAEVFPVIFSGITPHLYFLGQPSLPSYWKIRYKTGFDTVPIDLLDIIGKLAAIKLFHILGDIILGAGIASTSLGIDALSQSISTTSSATNSGYGARILGYVEDIKRSLPRLKNFYKGFTVQSL